MDRKKKKICSENFRLWLTNPNILKRMAKVIQTHFESWEEICLILGQDVILKRQKALAEYIRHFMEEIDSKEELERFGSLMKQFPFLFTLELRIEVFQTHDP